MALSGLAHHVPQVPDSITEYNHAGFEDERPAETSSAIKAVLVGFDLYFFCSFVRP